MYDMTTFYRQPSSLSLLVWHVSERVEDSHGEGEGQTEEPDEHYHNLRAKLARLSSEGIHDGAVPKNK